MQITPVCFILALEVAQLIGGGFAALNCGKVVLLLQITEHAQENEVAI